MGLRKITEADLTGRGVIGMADTPNLSARRMQEKVEEVVRSVVIPVMNENAEKAATKQDLADAVFNSGAGDMQAAFYDENKDGTVNRADNGLFVYTQSGTVLSGSGSNGKFKVTAGGIYTAFTIDGHSYSVRSGGENEVELTAGVWYTFVLDIRDKTINFKQGGARLNFKIVGGTTRPETPRENTIWINTDTAIGEYVFRAEPNNKVLTSTKTATNQWGFENNSKTLRAANPNERTAVFECLPDTEYTLTKSSGNLWYVAASRQAPAAGVDITVLKATSNDASTATAVRTPANARYLYIFVNNQSLASECTASYKKYLRDDGSDLQAGDLWIRTAAQSNISLNALTKNALIICLTYAFQWDDARWVQKDGQIYQNQKWLPFKVLFYEDGKQYTDLTGGYEVTRNDNSRAAVGENFLQVSSTAADNGLWPASYISTKSKIDFTGIGGLRFVGRVTSYANGGGGEHYSVGYLGISSANSNDGNFAAKVNITQAGDFDVRVDTSACVGEYYIVIGSMAHGHTPNYITMQVTQITGS